MPDQRKQMGSNVRYAAPRLVAGLSILGILASSSIAWPALFVLSLIAFFFSIAFIIDTL